MPVLALDVGGANIKLANAAGYADSMEFPLWKRRDDLPEKLKEVRENAPVFERIALTMTGELADCFGTKQEGVRFILSAVQSVFSDCEIRVYLTTGELVSVAAAAERPLDAAASNWHALGRYACRHFPAQADGAVIDVGSTTTDFVPVRDGKLIHQGRTDPERLLAGELVYSGIERTPICAMAQTVQLRGADCPLAAEFFATSLDIFLVMGLIDEATENHETADNRPATREFAKSRLARMVCADAEELTWTEVNEMARELFRKQVKFAAARWRHAMSANALSPDLVVISGHGDFLAEAILDAAGITSQRIYFSDLINDRAARCGPAYALAVWAEENW
ncbi:MAG: hydantoinase/oxoprolinase family protein [Blastopirellula sp. JB062]